MQARLRRFPRFTPTGPVEPERRGGSAYAPVDEPYPAAVQAAARDGTLQPLDYTNQNSSFNSFMGATRKMM